MLVNCPSNNERNISLAGTTSREGCSIVMVSSDGHCNSSD